MSRLPSIGGLAAAILAMGCGLSADSEPAPARVAAAAPDRIELAGVTWPAAAEIDRAALAALPAPARAQVASASMPVLVPRRAELLSSATLMAKPSWYAVSARGDGYVVSLHATRAAHRYASIGPAKGDRAIRGAAGFVTRNEGIWSASWIENGVAYVLDVECADPAAARCADDAFLGELAADLAFVGGAGVKP